MHIKFCVPGWTCFVSDKANLDNFKVGKWVVPTYGISDNKLDELCERALEEGVVECCKHSDGVYELFNANSSCGGLLCFYNNFGEIEAQKKLLNFLIENELIKREEDCKTFKDIEYVMYPEDLSEYDSYPPIQKLSDFMELATGEYIK